MKSNLILAIFTFSVYLGGLGGALASLGLTGTAASTTGTTSTSGGLGSILSGAGLNTGSTGSSSGLPNLSTILGGGSTIPTTPSTPQPTNPGQNPSDIVNAILNGGGAGGAVLTPANILNGILNEVTINCRVREAPGIMDTNKCFAASPLNPGECFFDHTKKKCFCPVKDSFTCSSNKQCYWKSKGSSGQCIHNTERLYIALFDKLRLRGKKSLALQVFYNSKPAKVSQPYGAYGPMVVDAFGAMRVSLQFSFYNWTVKNVSYLTNFLSNLELLL